ncbi:MAG: hypothetical protein IPH93_06075 [Saprospiraceae bacterium]|nr:hypothetical protein [Saprospiraceae bacterium]
MKTNSQICKLILPNSISQHYLKFPLLFMLFSLFVLSGCKDESIESSANDFLKGNEAESGVLNVPCPSTNFTIPLNCRTNNSNNCTRRDLDPCIYVKCMHTLQMLPVSLTNSNGCPYFELQVYHHAKYTPLCKD